MKEYYALFRAPYLELHQNRHFLSYLLHCSDKKLSLAADMLEHK